MHQKDLNDFRTKNTNLFYLVTNQKIKLTQRQVINLQIQINNKKKKNEKEFRIHYFKELEKLVMKKSNLILTQNL